MPRPSFPNTVQQFTPLFSTEEACESYLERCRWPDGFVCVRCGSLHGWRIVRAVRSRARSAPPGTTLRRVVWECADCHEQVSLTSGTILDSTKLPLTIWFLAAFFAVTDKRGLSATLLARHLGLGSYKTAWFLLHKLRRAMVNANRTKLRGRIEIDGTWVGGYQPGLKGGRQLKGRKAAMVLVAAETVTVQEKTRAVRIRAEVVYNEDAVSVADFITRLIELGSVIVSDGLPPVHGRDARTWLRSRTQGPRRPAQARSRRGRAGGPQHDQELEGLAQRDPPRGRSATSPSLPRRVRVPTQPPWQPRSRLSDTLGPRLKARARPHQHDPRGSGPALLPVP